MGDLVSVETLKKIIERDKRAGTDCTVCCFEAEDDIHVPPLTGCTCDECVGTAWHPFNPYLSRAAKDRRLLLRTLNNIVEEWGTYEAAARLDRMIVDILLAAGKKKGD